MDIWTACKERIVPELITGVLIRVVESQEQVATNQLVDSLQEQEMLESLLESTKPVSRHKKLHYLLHTPFRYPPLRHGSRFGRRSEPSLFYGSLGITTALAETAYYRCLFWAGMSSQPATGKFTTQHTLFSTRYQTTSGLKLHHAPFKEYQQRISHPADYTASQALGAAMRENGIELFEYVSARDKASGINIAMFNDRPLADKAPQSQQSWLCETTAKCISFLNTSDDRLYQYPTDSFMIDGGLPSPAL